MEPVRPPTGPVAPQAVAKVTPLGRGWMLVAVEAGFALRNAGQGVDLRLKPDEAEALQKGQITPEALANRSPALPQGPQGPQVPQPGVNVAFSPEALRLSGRMGTQGGGRAAPAPKGAAAGPVRPVPRWVWIGAALAALLVVVLIGTS